MRRISAFVESTRSFTPLFFGIYVVNHFSSLGLFARMARWAAAFAGAGLTAATPLQAQSVAPSVAPVEWVRYAETATSAVTRLLEAEGEVAIRLRGYLDATRPAPNQPTAPFVLKLWVDKDSSVSRIDFAPFVHSQANTDLRSLIVGQTLGTVPPKDMLLPLRIAVQLPATSDPASTSAVAPASR